MSTEFREKLYNKLKILKLTNQDIENAVIQILSIDGMSKIQESLIRKSATDLLTNNIDFDTII